MTDTRAIKWQIFLILLGLFFLISGIAFLTAPQSFKAETSIEYVISPNSSYDPYFIQIECEAIQSSNVLERVVQQLHLTETWNKKYSSGRQPEVSDCFKILRKKLGLEPVRNALKLKIYYESDDRDEALNIVNAIAKSYLDYRAETYLKLQARGIMALKSDLLEQHQRIADLKTNIIFLGRREPESKAYQEATNKLERMKTFTALLENKIQELNANIEPPPKTPPNIKIGPSSVVLDSKRHRNGLFFIALGTLLSGVGFIAANLRQPDRS